MGAEHKHLPPLPFLTKAELISLGNKNLFMEEQIVFKLKWP